jgi:membrane dipeptidase
MMDSVRRTASAARSLACCAVRRARPDELYGVTMRYLTASLIAAAVTAGPAWRPAEAQGATARSPGTTATPGASGQDPYMAMAIRVLKTTPLIDGHNDLPWRIREDSAHPSDVVGYDLRQHTPGQTDLDRLKRGMVGGQFWSVYIPGEREAPTYVPANGAVTSVPGFARVELEQIDIARRFIARYPDQLAFARGPADIRREFKEGKVASLLGIEGGHAIENSLGALRAYYDLGVRYMTLTHFKDNDWADAATDSVAHGGLTPFGKEVVREMNRLGMLVDLSHVSPGTMSDALTTTAAPVIFSHSGARALVNHVRNVPDSILRRVTTNGGVVMVPFVTNFVSVAVFHHDSVMDALAAQLRQRFPGDTAAQHREMKAWRDDHPAPPATLVQVADHIDHIRAVAGVDHVGIGADLDGGGGVEGLDDVSKYPDLFAELARRGWTESDLRKLAGENLLRVFAQTEAVAARLQRERPASIATIEELDHPAVKQ